MPQKQTRIQKNQVKRRREEVKTEVKVPKKTNPEEIKKKLKSSKEVLEKIDELLKEASVKVKKAEELWHTVNYRPRVPDCEGRMIDLFRKR